jgi:hypothetical protein
MYKAGNSEARPRKRWPVAIAAGMLGAAVLCQPDSAHAFPLAGGFHGGGFHGGRAGGYGGWGHGGWAHGGWAGGYGHGYGGYGYGNGYPVGGFAFGGSYPLTAITPTALTIATITLTHATPRCRAAEGASSLAVAHTPPMAAGPLAAGGMAAGPAVTPAAGSTAAGSTAAEPASDLFRLPSAAAGRIVRRNAGIALPCHEPRKGRIISAGRPAAITLFAARQSAMRCEHTTDQIAI